MLMLMSQFYLTDENTYISPIVAIVAGCIIFVIAFLGCCGSITENKSMIFSVSSYFIIFAFDFDLILHFL